MLTASNDVEIQYLKQQLPGLAIAIDGPAGAGKSTVAQRVAIELGYLYIDTGAMYRAATWVALQQRADLNDHQLIARMAKNASIELKQPDSDSGGRVRVFVNGDDVSMIVRSRVISKFVSQVAAIAGVREILVGKQQLMAAHGGVVMDGRDIGTVVLPQADVKIFLTASVEIRAERRLKELRELGQMADLTTLMQEIETRDHLDSTRQTSPLRKAPGATVINTDTLTIDEVVDRVLALAREKIASASVGQPTAR